MGSAISVALSRFAPPAGGALRARLERTWARGWFFALLVSVWLAYAFMVSAGVADWPVYGVYHDLQADGFLAGKLSLPLVPDPHLLSAKDPYDRVNLDYWSLDASYYRGKYYIYWGPVPALIQAAVKGLLHIHRTIGDQYLALFFQCLAFWGGALLIERLLLRLFASKSRALVVLGSLVFAFANPTPHAATTASTYHTAIMAAQSFMVVGLTFAFDAVWHAGTPNARRWRLLAAGTAWGLALASRISMLLPVALLVLLTAAAEAWPARRRGGAALLGLLWLGAPLSVVSLALLGYNKLRFDDWLEFGNRLQLSGMLPFRVSSIYVLPNLYTYAFRPWRASCAFPYLYQVWNMGSAAFPASFSLPADYMVLEPVIGWVLAVPFTWLIPLAFVLAPGRSAGWRRRDRAYLFCLSSAAVLASLTGLAELGLYTTTMRYLSDITFGLVLLGLLGGYGLRYHRFGTVRPGPVSGLLLVLAAATVAIGLLIGYQGYNDHFRRFNPALDNKLVRALSVCRGPIPDPPNSPK